MVQQGSSSELVIMMCMSGKSSTQLAQGTGNLDCGDEPATACWHACPPARTSSTALAPAPEGLACCHE